jgi:hypothetical protein
VRARRIVYRRLLRASNVAKKAGRAGTEAEACATWLGRRGIVLCRRSCGRRLR